jgi:hypothetical protein
VLVAVLPLWMSTSTCSPGAARTSHVSGHEFPEAHRGRTMHPDELMKSDRLSEALLLSCGVLIAAVVLVVILAACLGQTIAP